jgi:hypothetical protein
MQAKVELHSVVYHAVMLEISHAAGIEHDLGKGKHRPFFCQDRPGEQQKCEEDQPPRKGMTGMNQS